MAQSYRLLDGERYNLSEKEYNQFQITQGQTAKKAIDRLITMPGYKMATEETKRKLIKDIYSYAQEQAKIEFFAQRKVPYEPDGKRLFQAAQIMPVENYLVLKSQMDVNGNGNISQAEFDSVIADWDIPEEQKTALRTIYWPKSGT